MPSTKRLTGEDSALCYEVPTWERLSVCSLKRVVKREILYKFVKVKGMDTKTANLRLQLKQGFGFFEKPGS